MKEKLAGKKSGFSTVEIIIALAIISIALVGSINGNFSGQYWIQTGRARNEGLEINKKTVEKIHSLLKKDFYKEIPIQESYCSSENLCYFTQNKIINYSSCSKHIESTTFWKMTRYPTTSTSFFTNVSNTGEVINMGGDCLLEPLKGNWQNTPQTLVSIENSPSKQFTGIDILNNKIYTTENTFPSFNIFDPSGILVGSYDIKVNGFSVKANFVDVIKETSTGRLYAFVAVATTTNQLVVLDVTDETNPILKNKVTLKNVSTSGSYPQGYKVFAYGNRLYVTTRETAGFEFHIFNIKSPEFPIEIGNGFELNRTVNDMYIREQKINGSLHRLVFLASDSNLKELGILDVTGDNISEINSLNLSGNQDGLSLSLSGNFLYFGRSNNTTGPELYVFDLSNIYNLITILSQAEVGTNITSVKVSGDYVYLGTTKAGENFQVWNSDFNSWNSSVLNQGRFTSYNFPNIIPLGIDFATGWIAIINNSVVSDKIQILYTL